MNFEQLEMLRDQLIDIRNKQEVNSDIFLKCTEALDIIEDLMADMMIANGNDFQQENFARLFNELTTLQTSVFGTLVFCPLAKH